MSPDAVDPTVHSLEGNSVIEESHNRVPCNTESSDTAMGDPPDVLVSSHQHPYADPAPSIDHLLLILTDSALPLGSFAFSSGLESFIAHRRPQRVGPIETQKFLALSIASVSSTTLPYVIAAHRAPQDIMTLDNDFDASTLCSVTRKASTAQGRALIGVWERSLVESLDKSADNAGGQQALRDFAAALRSSRSSNGLTGPNGHLPPLWGAVCSVASIPLATTAYIYLFKHAQAVLSAAVRASTIGPYQAQAILASKWLQAQIRAALKADWETQVSDAGQVIPIMDFWLALHDKLYSKIFSS